MANETGAAWAGPGSAVPAWVASPFLASEGPDRGRGAAYCSPSALTEVMRALADRIERPQPCKPIDLVDLARHLRCRRARDRLGAVGSGDHCSTAPGIQRFTQGPAKEPR